uniref:Uncharacterized protein n=1 Tax=Brassica campestris TaxID=3711 RepID=A0A3P5ZDF1_BRACM|nr:unnamed protein product [Brassica rapa]
MHETSLSINDNKIRKSFFQSMENAKKDLKKEHIDGAFAMLNCRRNENAAWFHNYKIPKACFLPMEFLHCLLSDDLAYKKEKKRITRYDCFQKESNSIDIPQVKKLTVLISNLLVESSGDEVDKVKMIPFEIEHRHKVYPRQNILSTVGYFLSRF